MCFLLSKIFFEKCFLKINYFTSVFITKYLLRKIFLTKIEKPSSLTSESHFPSQLAQFLTSSYCSNQHFEIIISYTTKIVYRNTGRLLILLSIEHQKYFSKNNLYYPKKDFLVPNTTIRCIFIFFYF